MKSHNAHCNHRKVVQEDDEVELVDQDWLFFSAVCASTSSEEPSSSPMSLIYRFLLRLVLGVLSRKALLSCCRLTFLERWTLHE